MRLAAGIVAVSPIWALSPALGAPETAEGFATAMQGCWNRVTWSAEVESWRNEPGYTMASQMCLSGGVDGALTIVDCSGANDLVECSSVQGRYEFSVGKFWRDLGGARHGCDVLLDPGKQVVLQNCVGLASAPAAEPVSDVTYERVIGQ
jgi:hypothetical protein